MLSEPVKQPGQLDTIQPNQSDSSRDPGPRRRPLPVPMARPLVVYLLVAVNIVLWLLTTWQAVTLYHADLGGAITGDDQAPYFGLTQALLNLGGEARDLIAQGEWWRLFTAMFLHAGLPHIGLNMWALVILGQEAEALFGRLRFLLLYLLSGLAGSVASLLFSNSELSVGASGAIFGVIGLLAAYYFAYRNQLGSAGRTRFYNIIAVIGLNMVLSLSVSRIDNWAHIGGLLGGIVLGFLLLPKYAVVAQPNKRLILLDRLSPMRQLAALASYAIVLVGLFALALSRL